MKRLFTLVVLVLMLIAAIDSQNSRNTKSDDYHSFDGSEIVCRVSGCGRRPLYADWDNRFCAEHIYRSRNHSNEYDSSIACKKYNTEKALTKEEAEALQGTGYHGCWPNSSAELSELEAAMVKCINCGMRSHNGINSLCYECQYNKEHGFN